MLLIGRLIFTVVGSLFAIYSLVTENVTFLPYMVLSIGFTMLIAGVEEFQKERKLQSAFYVSAFLFLFFVFFQGLLPL